MPYAPRSERGVVCPFQTNEGPCKSQFRNIFCEPHPREPQCVQDVNLRARTLAVMFPQNSDLTQLMTAKVDERYDIIDGLLPTHTMDNLDGDIEYDSIKLNIDPKLYYDGVIHYALEFIKTEPDHYKQFGYKF